MNFTQREGHMAIQSVGSGLSVPRNLTRTVSVGVLLIGLAIAAVSCEAPNDKPVVEERMSAVSAPWLYYPLDAINDFWAGYHGYGFSINGVYYPPNIHNAYDLVGNIGDNVRAAGHGTVVHVENRCPTTACTPGSCTYGGGCGNWVLIQHDGAGAGEWTKYCHMNDVSVKVNDVVNIGQLLGHVGQVEAGCGVPHLHFAVSTTNGGGSGCTVGANGGLSGTCIDPGSPPGVKARDCCDAGIITPNVQWVTSGSTVALAKNNMSGTATVNVQVHTGAGTVSVTRNGTAIGSTTSSQVFNFNIGDTYGFQATPASSYTFVNFCGDEPACSLNTTSNPMTGTITSASGYVYANFKANSPTCPAGSNWHLAGNYCWNEPGMSYTSAYHLYNCQSAGGSAGDLGNCGEGCHDEPVGVNDICYSAYCPTGGYWYGAGLYCGRASGMSNANPDIVYYCGGAGAKASINQWCSAACVVAPPGYNDHC